MFKLYNTVNTIENWTLQTEGIHKTVEEKKNFNKDGEPEEDVSEFDAGEVDVNKMTCCAYLCTVISTELQAVVQWSGHWICNNASCSDCKFLDLTMRWIQVHSAFKF